MLIESDAASYTPVWTEPETAF